MRIMGLDFGSKTTGVAVSDPLGIFDIISGNINLEKSYCRIIYGSRLKTGSFCLRERKGIL